MPYRDDTEALRSQVEALKADLKRADAEVATSRKAVTEAHQLRVALSKIEAQLAEVRGERVNPHVQRTTGVALAGGMALVVVGAMVARSSVTHVPVGYAPRAMPAYIQPVVLPRAPLLSGSASFAPRVFNANVDGAFGETEVKPNARCEVLVAATEIKSLGCRVTITCDDQLVYGGEGQGYLPCRVFGGEPTTGVDLAGLEDDGDPMLDMDLTRGRIVVTNDRPLVWRLDLTVLTASARPPPTLEADDFE